MKPKKPENRLPQQELFKTRLESFLSSKHPLVRLAYAVDWGYFDQAFGLTFSDRGRPALPTRLMVALSYLKHSYNLSDEAWWKAF